MNKRKPVRYRNHGPSRTFSGPCEQCGHSGILNRYVEPGTDRLVWGCDECELAAARERGYRAETEASLMVRAVRVGDYAR